MDRIKSAPQDERSATLCIGLILYILFIHVKFLVLASCNL
jgi:hypothetical protein